MACEKEGKEFGPTGKGRRNWIFPLQKKPERRRTYEKTLATLIHL